MTRVMFEILTLLETNEEPHHSAEVARQLCLHGIDLSERTVRYYFKMLDMRGYTEAVTGRGRRLTAKGRHELNHGFVAERVGSVTSRIMDTLCDYAELSSVEALQREYLHDASLDRRSVIDLHGPTRANLSCERGEPGTRLRVREARTALPGEGATGYPRAGVPVIEYLHGKRVAKENDYWSIFDELKLITL